MTNESGSERENLRVSIIGYIPAEEAPSKAHSQISDLMQLIAEETDIETEEVYGTMDVEVFDRISEEISEEAGPLPEDVFDHDDENPDQEEQNRITADRLVVSVGDGSEDETQESITAERLVVYVGDQNDCPR